MRLQPPKLEGHQSDADFDTFVQRLTNHSFVDPLPKDFRRPSTKLWSCSAASARTHAEHVGVTSITSSFLATDTKGLCNASARRVTSKELESPNRVHGHGARAFNKTGRP